MLRVDSTNARCDTHLLSLYLHAPCTIILLLSPFTLFLCLIFSVITLPRIRSHALVNSETPPAPLVPLYCFSHLFIPLQLAYPAQPCVTLRDLCVVVSSIIFYVSFNSLPPCLFHLDIFLIDLSLPLTLLPLLLHVTV